MTSLEGKLNDYIRMISEHDKKVYMVSESGLTEGEFKQSLYEHAASERELGTECAAIFAELLPALKSLRESPQYMSDNVEVLTSFANAISGSQFYFDKESPKPPDRYVSIIVYRALLENAMKCPTPTEAQIVLTRDLAMCFTHTSDFSLNREAIKYINRLFEKISFEDVMKLPEAAHGAYNYLKVVWMVNHFHSFDYDRETYNALLAEMDSFIAESRQYMPDYSWDGINSLIIGARMVMGTICEFGVQVEFTDAFAEELLEFTQENLNKADVDAYYYGTAHLAWAELSYRCGKIGDDEYWRILLEIAEKNLAEPPSDNINLSVTLLQTGLSAVAVLCKYYSAMNNEWQAECKRIAKACLAWVKGFSAKGQRRMLGHLGDELNTVCNVAYLGLTKHEKALNVLRLSTESTYAHSVLCAEMATDLAKSLLASRPQLFAPAFSGLSPSEILDEIYVGALLHDIGKMEVSGPISQVIRSIFDEEFAQIKTHPTRALRYLTAPEFACARACAVWHHEHFDGKGGYPLNYADENAEKYRFVVQLITFADCYTSALDRYKSAYQPQKKAADMVAELATLSRPEKSEKFRKDEGRILYNPIFSEELANNADLLAKYSNDEYVTAWIEKCYYNAYVGFEENRKV